LYGVNPSFKFDTAGTYSITLNVTDAAGNWDTDKMTVIVKDITKPNADAGPDQTVNQSTTVQFDGSGSSDNVGIVNYTWSLYYNGSFVNLYGVNPTFTFEIHGDYTVTLTVTDAIGLNDTDTVVINVNRTIITIDDLINYILSLNLPEGTENSLISKLENAKKSLDKKQYKAAKNQLNAFIHEVKALTEKKITFDNAVIINEMAQQIINNL
jgi:PKD repeat protein